ncbi:hypothetical protein ERO13_D08G107333v2 [Gossypium hirsutum]|nr:hypothetical protein ES319_D08G114600v1 [Gossypium barbadense]KAG4133651.1 hypothetical protein ERO13_D08G107333v2 [Gossypium hirsutum]TYG57169.1 hypothetical protein ES288_D08G121600v1 [Gossypium darwinii]
MDLGRREIEEIDEELGRNDKAEEGQDEVGLSPGSLLFLEPGTNCCIIAVIGCKTNIDPGIVKEGLKQTLVHHPRFSSKLQFVHCSVTLSCFYYIRCLR